MTVGASGQSTLTRRTGSPFPRPDVRAGSDTGKSAEVTERLALTEKLYRLCLDRP